MQRVTCDNDNHGRTCGRYLGEIDGDRIRFYCPRCQTFHDVPASDAIAELEAWLAEVKDKVRRKPLIKGA